MPTTSERLPYLAARLALRDLDAEAIKSTIHALMNEGYYDDTCLTAIDSSPARMDEVVPAFLMALKHFQVTNPNPELAMWILIKRHVLQIVENCVDPYEGLRAVIVVYDEYDRLFNDSCSQTSVYLPRSHCIQAFVSLYWGVDDRREQSLHGKLNASEWVEVKREIKIEAEKWLHELPTNAAYLQCLRQTESA